MRSFVSGPYRIRSLVLLSLVAVLSSVLPCSAQVSAEDAFSTLRPHSAQRRVSPDADLSDRVQIPGHLPPWARPANQAAGKSMSDNATLQVTVVLRRDAATQTAFEKLLADQQNPASPLYHHWLTPSQVGSMFGLAPADVSSVTSWLESEGLHVENIEPNGVLIEASGTVANISAAFRTNFAQFSVDSERRLSAIDEPSVPAALQAVIAGVHGLSQSTLHPQSRARAVNGRLSEEGGVRPMLTTSNVVHYVTPNDFATIYDLSAAYSGGNMGGTIAGKAQRIAIVGRSRVDPSDISQFESMAGLPNAQPNIIIATGGTDPGITHTGDQDEATLDVDRAMGTAPAAGVDLVVSADSATVSGVYLAASYAINTLVDPVLSISFGDCEANAGAQGVAAWDQLFSTAAAEGITVLVSSGDSGAAGCDGGSSTLPATQITSINYICASSYATCVGGTQFADTVSPRSYWSVQNGTDQSSALGYIPEGAWNEPTTVGGGGEIAYQASGSGGGVSQFIAKPSWQAGVGVPADGRRDVPDVSLSSAEHDGYVACLQYAGGDCGQKAFEVFGGTSAAAPGMAGIVALLNTATGAPAGNLNPLLYRLAADLSNGVFHDVTVNSSGVNGCNAAVPSICNNSTPSASGLAGGLAGFTVAAGYDQATGWGSVDVGKLIAAAATSSAPSPIAAPANKNGSFSLVSAASALTLNAGTESSATVSVLTTDGFVGTVGLGCTVAAVPGTITTVLPTCTMSQTSVMLAGSKGTATASATVAILSQATPESACNTGGTRANVRIAGAALASLCLLLIPARQVRRLRGLLMMLMAGVGISLITGCGGNVTNALSSACSFPAAPGTTPGNYIVTISGSSGSTTASTSFTVAVAK